MNYIFEIIDKSKRKIHLSKERWKHIKINHPNIVNMEEIKLALTNPTKIISSDRDMNVKWYYLYNKSKKLYLMVSVKYLNKKGYIITAFYRSTIQ